MVVRMSWRQKQRMGGARGASYSESRKMGRAVWTFSARGDHFFGFLAIDVSSRATPMLIAMYGAMFFGGWKFGDQMREREYRNGL